jgi:hypothetical protein
MEITRVKFVSNDDNDIVARFPDEEGYVIIEWEKESKIFDFPEFGQLVITKKKDGTITIDSEHLGRETVKEILCRLVDKAELVG